MNHIDNYKTFEGKFWDKLKSERNKNKLLKQADNQIKIHLKKYLLKKYSFQYGVYIWTGPHSNYEEIDVYDFEFIDLFVQPTYDLKSGKVNGFFIDLIFIDRDGDKFELYFNENSPTEKTGDLEYMKPWDKSKNALLGYYIEKRPMDKEFYDDEKNYPHKNGTIDLIPNEYKTIEFLKEVKSVLEIINDTI